MMNDVLINTVTTMVEGLIAADTEMFLVEVKIKPVNNIKVFIDADGGLPIEKCIKINRALYKEMEETAIKNVSPVQEKYWQKCGGGY
jgi:ribosome maturation factor RimP